MTQQNVEIVRELNEAFNRADGWVDFYDSSAEVHVPPGLIDRRVYAGHDGIRRAAALWTEWVNEYSWDLQQLIDAGDCVVGLFYFSSRTSDGGEWLKPPLGAVFYLNEGGKITRVLTYFSWVEALEVAGIEEQAADLTQLGLNRSS